MEEKEIAAIIKRFFSIDMEKVVMDSVKEYSREIVSMQQEQMFSGVASKGDPIDPAYTKNTRTMKKLRGQPTDRVTLKDKGNFYKRQFVRFTKNTFEVDSRDKKTADLKEKYHGNRGSDIFGLTEENTDRLAVITLPLVQDKFKDKLLR